MTADPSAPAPFVVFGPSKSGTTWLQRMLDTHPDTSCLFQPGLLPLTGGTRATARAITRSNASPYGGLFADASAEKSYSLRRRLMHSNSFLTSRHPRMIGGNEEISRLHRAMVRATVRTFLDETSNKRLKGFKQHVDVDFLIDAFPDARVVVIVRDGRDVTVSMRHHRLRQGLYYLGDERWSWLTALNHLPASRRVTKFLTGKSDRLRDWVVRDIRENGPLFSSAALEKAAKDWVLIIDYLIEKIDQYPDHTLLVRYEDLLDRPFEIMTGVFAFVGADTSPDTVDSVIQQTSMRKMKSNTQSGFFRKGVSGDWRNVYTQQNVDLFKRIAGDRLIRLGYEKDNDWTT